MQGKTNQFESQPAANFDFYQQHNQQKFYNTTNQLQEPSFEKENMQSSFNTQTNNKYFISSQGKNAKRDQSHTYDMPRTHSTSSMIQHNKSNQNTSFINTSTYHPTQPENYSFHNTTDQDQSNRQSQRQNVDKSFQYLKSQFNIQNGMPTPKEDLSNIYDIIPSKQPTTYYKNSEYSFSKIYTNNLNQSYQSKISDVKSVQRLINYNQDNYKTQQHQTLNLNDSIHKRDQNHQSMNYSMTLPQSTKNVNMTDIMYSTNSKVNQSKNVFNKPQHHLLYFQSQNKQRKLNEISDLSILSQTFDLEDDYRLQLIFLRLWQKAVKMIKKRRQQKKVFVRNLATAIHFNEQSLISKVILSFIKIRVLREQNRINAIKVCKKVRFNIKRFYFNMFIKKFKEVKWIQSGHTIAQIYFKKEMRKKIFLAIKKICQSSRELRIWTQKRIQSNPKAMRFMLQYIAMQYMNAKRVDLLEFHSFALAQNRVTGTRRQTFSNCIERSLIVQMNQVFQSWRSYTSKIVDFKNKVLIRKVRHAFSFFNKLRANSKKSRIQFYKYQLSLKYKSLAALRQNADFYQSLKKKQAIVSKMYQHQVFEKFYQNWKDLFNQYTHLMKESAFKTKLSHSNFLKKYFEGWLQYSKAKNHLKQQRMQSLIHFYERNIKLCFSQWSLITKRNKSLRKTEMKVNYIYRLSQKEVYLNEWMQRCYFNEMSRRLRVKILKQKFIESMRMAVRYRKVNQEINSISVHQYMRSLQLRAIQSIRIKVQEKQQLNNIKKAFQRDANQSLQRLIIAVLKNYTDFKKQRQEQSKRLKNFRDTHLQAKYFKIFRKGTLKLHSLRINYLKIQNYVQNKLKFRTLQKFASKLDRKQQLKYLLYQVMYKKQMESKQKVFYYMLNKRRDLANKFFQVSELKKHRAKTQVFNVWYQQASQIEHIRNGYCQLQNYQESNILRQNWDQWNKFVQEMQLQRKYYQVSTYFFLQKFLKKYLFNLRNHALIKIQKRKILMNLAVHRYKNLFIAFKKVLIKDIHKKKIYFRQISTILKRVMLNWHEFSKNQRQLRQNMIQLGYKREQTMKLSIVQILYQNKQCRGLNEQDQYHYMRMRKVQKVFDTLAQITQWYTKWMKMKPLIQQAEQLNDYLFARKAFKSVQQYVITIRRKREMLKSIEMYRQELLIHKTFRKLKSYHTIIQKINKQYQKNQVQFKQRCYQEWRDQYIKNLKMKRINLNQQKISYSLDKINKNLKTTVIKAFHIMIEIRNTRYQSFNKIKDIYDRMKIKHSLFRLQKHSKFQQKIVIALDQSDSFKKWLVLKALRLFISKQKLNQIMIIQAEAQNRIQLLKLGMRLFTKNGIMKRYMREVYAKTNLAYRRQLLQKSLWTLQWNKTRNHYLRNLVFKSEEFNNKRIKQQLYDVLKNLLIIKYKGIQIQQKHEYQLMQDFLGIWKYSFQQNEAQSQLQYYQQNLNNTDDMNYAQEQEYPPNTVRITPGGYRDSFYGNNSHFDNGTFQ